MLSGQIDTIYKYFPSSRVSLKVSWSFSSQADRMRDIYHYAAMVSPLTQQIWEKAANNQWQISQIRR